MPMSSQTLRLDIVRKRRAVPPQIAFQTAWSRKREVFLPVLHGSSLFFSRFTERSVLIPNRFGIPEPADEPLLRPSAMDVVIAPLVAFDESGNRLGMGGGFYDRSFRFLRYRRLWRRPRLVGFAFELQRVDHLDARAWDVPLDAVVTEYSKQEFPGK